MLYAATKGLHAARPLIVSVALSRASFGPASNSADVGRRPFTICPASVKSAPAYGWPRAGPGDRHPQMEVRVLNMTQESFTAIKGRYHRFEILGADCPLRGTLTLGDGDWLSALRCSTRNTAASPLAASVCSSGEEPIIP